jgi:uncharacterized protein YhaN
MRIERLNLVRFGKFTDYELEFPDPKNKGSDVHLIYGPNEAGKSTLFAAILDLMFGIPDRSPYGFMHDYSVMRIEGGFLHKKDKIELARVKRRHADLVGIDDRPLNHDPLIGMLGGLDRAEYRAMFSLDEMSLEAGGRELLKANGDFGRILFSASSGLSDLSDRLIQMDAEADAFYRRSGRQNKLRSLLETLDTLKKDQETHDINAANFDRLIETREIATISRQEAEEEEKTTREKQAILKRRLNVCSKLEDYRTAIAAVERLQDLPKPPPDARTQLELLRDNESTLKTRHTETERRIAAQKEKLASIEINATIVAASHQIQTITDLASRYRTATQDIPKRQRTLDETVAEIKARTRKLSNGKEAEPHSLFLEIEQTAKILELARDWPVLCERVKQAQLEVTRAEANKQDCPLSDAEHARLKTILYSIRSTELLNRYQQALNEERVLEIEVISAFDRLAPWEGNGEDLKSLKLPARSVLETWKNDLVSLRLRKANIQDLMDSARSRYTVAKANLDANRDLAAILDQNALIKLKFRRDEAWGHHRDTLTAETADIFATEMRAFDQAIDTQIANMSKLADLDLAKKVATEEKAKISDLKVSLKECQNNIRKINTTLAEVSEKLGLDPNTAPEALIQWTENREDALAINRKKNKALSLRAAAEREIKNHVQTLSKILNIEEDLATLVDAADTRLREAEIAREGRDVLRTRKTLLLKAEEDLEVWTTRWAEALGTSWIGSFSKAPQLIPDALSELRELENLIAKQEDLETRIRHMTDDKDTFVAKVRGILNELSLTIDQSDPEIGFELLKARLIEEQKSADQVETLEHSLASEFDTASAIQKEIAEHNVVKELFLKSLGVKSLSDASQILEEITQVKKSAETVANLEREILQAAGTENSDEALELLQSLDSSSLEAEIATLDSKITALAEATRERHADLREAQNALDAIGGDSVAAALQTRKQTVLEEIIDGTKKALRLRLGALAAKTAIESFRSEQQSDMLKVASEAFEKITCGAYKGLRTQAGSKGEELIAIDANGASRIEDGQMSAGTRAQLYLALRVAGFHTFADENSPPPFIADDIFETFDDNRAREAFDLLAGMGKRGQVLYLTHHQHLLDIATEAVPGVNIIRL